MNLHKDKENFEDLIDVTAKYIGIPVSAIRRDYYIVMMLQALVKSEYAEMCVFKGGTSLSKCYPGSINRFSEDIDLTFIPKDVMSNKQYDRALRNIEKIMTADAQMEKIPEERNNRNKSAYVWFDGEEKDLTKIKLEIGSSVRPDPYEKRTLKTYIQEYLETHNLEDAVREYDLEEVSINTLCVERTFLDKIMSVKRHAICGTLNGKVRHIYDVVALFQLKEIQQFMEDKDKVKMLIRLTKETDSFYLEKRNISKLYNPIDKYNFEGWKDYFDNNIKARYLSLHKDLLYTDEQQDFSKAIQTFEQINEIFSEIDE